MAKPANSAISHFDKFYPSIYSIKSWRSMRLALLTNPRKMFVVNNSYSDKRELFKSLKLHGCINFLENLLIKKNKTINKIENTDNENGAFPMPMKHQDEFRKSTEYFGESDIYSRAIKKTFCDYTSSHYNIEIAAKLNDDFDVCRNFSLPYEQIELPAALTVFAHPRGVAHSPLPVPVDEFGQCGFYPMDGFSILAVLMLNIKKGDDVLDMCAGPGGKSVVMLQTTLPGRLVCIEKSPSRFERLHKVLQTHSHAGSDRNKVQMIRGDSIQELEGVREQFDKVLVDVPCSTDRLAAVDPSFSLFAAHNYEKRQNMNRLQFQLLRTAVRACRLGGDVLYSTCSLSPVQNAKMVVDLVQFINKDPDQDYRLCVVDCHDRFVSRRRRRGDTASGQEGEDWFQVHVDADGLGTTIVPHLVSNYGPGYFCKIRKLPR